MGICDEFFYNWIVAPREEMSNIFSPLSAGRDWLFFPMKIYEATSVNYYPLSAGVLLRPFLTLRSRKEE